ncbi:MAG: type IV secretion system DNA-binding domain-containing protein [Candidatus Yonathbacteria bacterium]|nr:type IV secretion system DNA-binding domain-containing protein [Candidatus Yonathbacteria bacterium]
MYLYDKNRITYFAETDRRNKRVPFGIKAEDRTRHMYIIGKTGMGKSTLIENMVVQDIRNGEGFAFLDPHGKSAAMILDYIPHERVKDVVYFAPFDMDNPISFNVMEDVGPDKRHLVANGLMSAFKKIWGPETWSARMEYILMNTLLALLEYPESTLLGVNRMLTDKVYRKKVVDNIKDPSVKTYWTDEFAKYSEQYAKDATPAIQNKLGQFTSNPLIRNIIGQPHSSFDLRKMMDERKILIVNLSKGQLGEGNANLLGGMIITKIYLAAMSRADLNEGELKKLPNFYMYVDEFQSFANESFADILSEARKYKLALVVAHQYIKQMDEKVADAVFGNVGTQIMFRVGAPDAEVLEKEYAPVFTAEDMVSLGFTQIYLKLMIDGVASHPFSSVTLGPIAPPKKSLREEVIASSRALYGHPRAEVEKNIAEWYGSGAEIPPRESAREYPAPRADISPRPPVVRRDSNAMFERPRQNFSPRQNFTEIEAGKEKNSSGQAAKPEKLEKPFAQAFKTFPKPEQKQQPKPVPESASFSTLTQARPAARGVILPTKSKGPTTAGLSGLKAALAGVLEALPATASSNTSGADRRWQAWEKKESAAEPKVLPVTPKQQPLRERDRETPTKLKEVPEDVLTAILRGDE